MGKRLALTLLAATVISTTAAVWHYGEPMDSARERLRRDSGQVAFNVTVACTYPYAPSLLSRQDFAVDGVVIHIELAPGQPHRRLLTLEVKEWFKLHGPHTAEIVIAVPAASTENGPPSYSVGSRLLVGGAVANDGTLSADLCGFTRHYDAATADEWRRALTT